MMMVKRETHWPGTGLVQTSGPATHVEATLSDRNDNDGVQEMDDLF